MMGWLYLKPDDQVLVPGPYGGEKSRVLLLQLGEQCVIDGVLYSVRMKDHEGHAVAVRAVA